MTFKPSKITPGFNLTWEGSRMMLPEHVEMLRKRRSLQRKRRKPELDMQKMEEIDRNIRIFFQQKERVRITVFGSFNNRVYEGQIATIDVEGKRIKLASDKDDGYGWIDFASIIEIEKIQG